VIDIYEKETMVNRLKLLILLIGIVLAVFSDNKMRVVSFNEVIFFKENTNIGFPTDSIV
jgi:hypothetical protein